MDVEQRIERLDKRMTQIEQNFDDVRHSIKRIENAVTGDQAFGVVGYKQKFDQYDSRFEDIEDDVDGLKHFKIKVMYYALGGAAAGTVAINVALNYL